MVFGEVVGKVLAAGTPVWSVVQLSHSVMDPMEAHVHGAWASHAAGFSACLEGSGIVSLRGDRRLEVSHFFKGGSCNGTFLCTNKEVTNFLASVAEDVAQQRMSTLTRTAPLQS
jgi:hypothetical protein